MQKARARRALGAGLDYGDLIVWKLLLLAVAAFLYGLYRGITGRPLEAEPRDSQEGRALQERAEDR
jgi:hypothetical protein